MFRLYLEAMHTHIEHLEDVILDHGISQGLALIIKVFSSPSTKTAVKFDGKPFIMFGIDPQNGQFVIGTKSIKKRPMYSKEDIQKEYNDNPDIANKLINIFDDLKQNFNRDCLLGGEFMFWPAIKKMTKSHVIFQPNTVIYQVKTNTELGRQIEDHGYGIVVHTEYRGIDLQSLTQRKYKLNNTESWGNVLLMPDEQKGSVDNLRQVVPYIVTLKNTYSKCDIAYNLIKTHRLAIKSLMVVVINNDKHKNATPEFMNELRLMIRSRYKTEKKQSEIDQIFVDYGEDLKGFFECYFALIKIKNRIIDELAKENDIETYFKKDFKIVKSSSGEGFVLANENVILKLVKRSEFSALNRSLNA